MPQLTEQEVLDRCINTVDEHIQRATNTLRGIGLADKAIQLSNSWFAIKKKLKDSGKKKEDKEAQQWEDQREAMYDAWKRKQKENNK